MAANPLGDEHEAGAPFVNGARPGHAVASSAAKVRPGIIDRSEDTIADASAAPSTASPAAWTWEGLQRMMR